MFILSVIYSPRHLMHTTNILTLLSPSSATLPLELNIIYPLTPFLSSLSLFQQVVSAVRAGVNPVGSASNQTSLWDISSSFFFAGTVITTIGKMRIFSFSPLHFLSEVLNKALTMYGRFLFQ